jgi:hypothetical protein
VGDALVIAGGHRSGMGGVKQHPSRRKIAVLVCFGLFYVRTEHMLGPNSLEDDRDTRSWGVREDRGCGCYIGDRWWAQK